MTNISSESRVFAMLDEEGGGWKERQPTLNGQPLPPEIQARLDHIRRETNAAMDDFFAGRVPMLPLIACDDDDEPSDSLALQDRQAQEGD